MGRKSKRSNWRKWEDNTPNVREPTPIDEEQMKRIAEEKAAIEKAKRLYAAFRRFPIEVLGNILKWLPSTDEFQLTSKAFRSNVLQIPSLWTSVSSYENPEYYIQRSKGCGLDVKIEFIDAVEPRLSVDRLRVFLLLLEPHHSRFKSLTIYGSESRLELWKVIHSQLLNRTFASLQKLGYGTASTASSRFDIFTPDGSQKDLISSFTVPSLESLVIRNHFPTEMIKIKTPPTKLSLTVSHFKENAYGYSNAKNKLLDSITSMIQSYSQLTELTLHVDNFHSASKFSRDITVDIPTLRTLWIHCVSSDKFLPTIGISAPNLTKLLIQCDILATTTSRTLLEELFPKDKCRWPCLEILDLCLAESDDDYSNEVAATGRERIIDIVLSRLPNIKSLNITSRHYLPPTAISVLESERRESSSYPPLQSLSISDSDIETAFLVTNREILTSPTFKELRVTNCPGIMQNVLRSILPPEKTLVYNGIWVRMLSI